MSGEPQLGWVGAEVRAEFPELRLWTMRHPVAPGRSNEGLKQRLRLLSDRFRGATAITMRQDPIPHAYRVFYRHIGLDPDADRTPVEQAAVDRLVHGGFRSESLVGDALTLALVETGVPVWALDAARVQGDIGIRLAVEDETVGRGELANAAHPGRLVVCDDLSPLADLFGPVAAPHDVTADTRELLLFTVQPAGVPAIHVEEALWTCVEALDSA
jgi:DNA/RNA-binding domain of Phe-tRNA-synthetase-like protein